VCTARASAAPYIRVAVRAWRMWLLCTHDGFSELWAHNAGPATVPTSELLDVHEDIAAMIFSDLLQDLLFGSRGSLWWSVLLK